MVGTPYYMSPEQAFGEKDIDGRADLWAVGVMIYECLAGVRPTEARNVGQVLKTLAHLSIPPLSEVAPEVPASMAALIGDVLCERDRRVATAEQLGARLKAIAAQPEQAVSAEASVVAARQSRTRYAGLLAAVLLSLGVAVSVLWMRNPRVPPPTAPIVSEIPSIAALPSEVIDAQPAVSALPSSTASARARIRDKPLDAGAPPLPATPSATSSAGPGGLLMTPPF
jgi:serine/threonine-protein kinase